MMATMSAAAKIAAAPSTTVIASTTWAVYVILGFFFLFLMTRTTNAKLDAVLVRAASAAFLAAGFVGSQGIVGDWIHRGTVSTEGVAKNYGLTVVFGVTVGLLGLFLILTWLPEGHFKGGIPDWLSISGLFLPSLLRTVPGPFGDGVTNVLTGMSHLFLAPVNYLFGLG